MVRDRLRAWKTHGEEAAQTTPAEDVVASEDAIARNNAVPIQWLRLQLSAAIRGRIRRKAPDLPLELLRADESDHDAELQHTTNGARGRHAQVAHVERRGVDRDHTEQHLDQRRGRVRVEAGLCLLQAVAHRLQRVRHPEEWDPNELDLRI